MCGLVGMAGNLAYKSKDVLSSMLTLSSLRGMHSTGVFLVKGKKDEVKIAKQVGPPCDLIDTKSYDKLSSYDATIAAGHTRHATVGNVSRLTAHPFDFENLVGMHNGTLQGWKNYLDDDEFFEVDSECLYHNINEHGIEKVVPKLRGAWALVWFDKKSGELNFLRNKERSLWYCFNEKKDKIFWASEYWMLGMLKSKHGGSETLWVNKEGHTFFPFEEDMWTRMRIEDDKITIKAQRKLEGDSAQPAAVQRPFHTGLGNPYHTPKGGYQTAWQRQQEQNRADRTAEEKRNTNSSTTSAKVSQGGEANQTTLIGLSPTPPSRSLSLVTTPKDVKSQGSQSKKRALKKTTSTIIGIPASKGASPVQSEDANSVVMIENFRGEFVNYERFREVTKGACCSFCQDSVTEEEFNKEVVHTWLDSESFLCTRCLHEQGHLSTVNS